jgi:hypothetical protein
MGPLAHEMSFPAIQAEGLTILTCPGQHFAKGKA